MASSSSSSFSFPLLFSLLIIILSLFSTSSSSVVRKQVSTLLSLKQTLQTTGTFFDTWDVSNSDQLCSSWSGVRCDEEKTVVVSLNMSNANISGIITSKISDLHGLTYLNLAGNSISGRFPPEVCLLRNLKEINISSNNFNGTFSDWDFSGLVELEVFDAYNNDFRGSLPLAVVGLQNLLHLDLGGNYISGRIPRRYGEFRKLEYLSLAGNDLGGLIPPEIGNVTSLKQLSLGYYNYFTGGIPAELGKLSELVHLDLSSCGLDSGIPPELGNLKNLDTLFLQTNRLTGVIPPELGNLTGLKYLDLSNNEITGGIPLEFSNLKRLYLFNLFINRFHREIPAFVADFPDLEILNLWENNFTGTIPAGLGKNGKLRDVDLSTNKLTGVIPGDLCHGRKLEILILLNNFLFGPIPADLSNCGTLSRVRMGQNYLSGPIPRGFLFLPDLILVELQNNYLTGRISDKSEQSIPSRLEQLNLSNNRLFGPIPSSLGDFPALRMLKLSGNQFTGAIPSQLGKLKHVLKIDLSGNNFSGSLPPEIGGCPLLTYLDISRNQLSSVIPPEISEAHVLNYLNFSWNRLNGSIPKEMGGMKSLTSIDLSHNNLTGRVPENGQFAYFNASSFEDNPNLCGLTTTIGLPLCNYTSIGPSTQPESHNGSQTLAGAGNLKLVFAVTFLACSLVFVIATILVRTKLIFAKNSRSNWKMTTFKKLDFTKEDIVGCLKDANIIGRGGAGVVYRGTMPNGVQIAVKKLTGIGGRTPKGCPSSSSPSPSPQDNGFSAEIETLGKIRHRNIVRLLAFCSNDEMNLLVYEYMANGSLGEAIHGGGYLNWEVRVKIAIDAAKGLCYLHHDCRPAILHRDVKSNNILLDCGLEAHVADFGLAKYLKDSGGSECMSAIAGSYGYIAPEYAYTLKVDEKSDVYSFGVVLLELVTGRRPVGDFGEEGMDIVRWAKASTEGNKEGVVKILDKRLEGAVLMEEAMQVFFVAMLCVQERSFERPTMREVVQMLLQKGKTDGIWKKTKETIDPSTLPLTSLFLSDDYTEAYKAQDIQKLFHLLPSATLRMERTEISQARICLLPPPSPDDVARCGNPMHH